MTRVGCIVLCGGESRRMGRSKALLEFRGEAMLSRVVRAVHREGRPIVVSCRAGQTLPPLPGDVELVTDPIAGVGPLGGLLGGLTALSDSCDVAFVCACDQALLRPAFVDRLIELWQDQAVVVVEDGGRMHGLTGLYRTDLVPRLQAQIESGDYRVRSFVGRCDPQVFSGDAFRDIDPELESLRNMNTPADLADPP